MSSSFSRHDVLLLVGVPTFLSIQLYVVYSVSESVSVTALAGVSFAVLVYSLSHTRSVFTKLPAAPPPAWADGDGTHAALQQSRGLDVVALNAARAYDFPLEGERRHHESLQSIELISQCPSERPLVQSLEEKKLSCRLFGAAVQLKKVCIVNRTYASFGLFINAEDTEWDVWRRYSDFVKLRKKLAKRRDWEIRHHAKQTRQEAARDLEGIDETHAASKEVRDLEERKIWDLPALPPRTFGRRLEDRFLRRRRAGLQLFVEGILVHPHLCDYPEVRLFFGLLVLRDGDDGGAGGDQVKGEVLQPGEELVSPTGMSETSEFEEKDEYHLPSASSLESYRAPALNGMWGERPTEPGNRYKIRGLDYLQDRVKVEGGPPGGTLVHFDVFNVIERADHVVSKYHTVVDHFQATYTNKNRPFLYIVNFQMPGSPQLCCVAYWALNLQRTTTTPDTTAASSSEKPRTALEAERHLDTISTPSGAASQRETGTATSTTVGSTAGDGEEVLECGESGTDTHHKFLDLFEKFVDGGDDFRNARFKMIPTVVEGPYVVTYMVKQKPALLGQKLTQRYFRGKGYLEIDIDIASSVIAEKTVTLCRNYAKELVVDIAMLTQGESKAELPEKLIGSMRLTHLDLTKGVEPVLKDTHHGE